MSHFRATGNAAFTLIELMAVITIIGMLAALISVAHVKARAKAKRVKTYMDMQCIVNAIMAYHVEYNKWPGQEQNTVDRTYKDGSHGSHLQGNIYIALGTRESQNLNPRGIQFIKTGGNRKVCPVSGCWLDLNGEHYIIAIDENNDGITHLEYDQFQLAVPDQPVLVMSQCIPANIGSWMRDDDAIPVSSSH